MDVDMGGAGHVGAIAGDDRAHTATGQGIWPAHWMMPDNKACWPSNGEIDIMEMVNGDGITHATYHWRERETGGCGDTCGNGSKVPACRHPSIGATHKDG